jgi:hypothetical protein
MQYYDNYVQRKRRRPDLSGGQRNVATGVAQPAPHNPTEVMVPAETNRQEWLKLGGVYGVIALCATVMSFVLGFDLQIWLEWFMGGFFIIFGSFKLIGYEAFVLTFPQYDPIAARSRIYTIVYPFIELFLGFLYVANLLPVFRDVIVLAIFGIGAWGVLRYTSQNKDQTIQCACLGNIIKLPLSTVTLIEDVLMAVLSVIMLIGYLIF